MTNMISPIKWPVYNNYFSTDHGYPPPGLIFVFATFVFFRLYLLITHHIPSFQGRPVPTPVPMKNSQLITAQIPEHKLVMQY